MSVREEKITETRAGLEAAEKVAVRASAERRLALAAVKVGGSRYEYERAAENSEYASLQLRVARARYEEAQRLPE